MPAFVALRVLVSRGESNRAALERTLEQGRIPFPLTLCTRYGHATYGDATDIPPRDVRGASGDFLVKFEQEGV